MDTKKTLSAILNKNSQIYSSSSEKGLDIKIIGGNIYRVSGHWQGKSEEYFDILSNALKDNKLIYMNEIIYESKNPREIDAALKYFCKKKIILPLNQ